MLSILDVALCGYQLQHDNGCQTNLGSLRIQMGIKETFWWFVSWMLPGGGMWLEVRAAAAINYASPLQSTKMLKPAGSLGCRGRWHAESTHVMVFGWRF